MLAPLGQTWTTRHRSPRELMRLMQVLAKRAERGGRLNIPVVIRGPFKMINLLARLIRPPKSMTDYQSKSLG